MQHDGGTFDFIALHPYTDCVLIHAGKLHHNLQETAR